MDPSVYSFALIDDKGRNFEKVGDVFYLPHNSDFKIVFHNRSDKRANVEFMLDGVVVGEFRSNPHSNIKLERPVNKNRAFKFVSVNSKEGKQGRLDLAPKLGTIEIRVDPEQEYNHNIVYDLNKQRVGVDEIDGPASIGGTVLGRSSDQSFTFAEHIPTTGQIVKLFAKMMVKLEDVAPSEVESLHI